MPARLEFVVATPQAVATELDENTIHLWRIPYHADQGRAPLVHCLAAYLDTPASDIVVTPTDDGKPMLANGSLAEPGKPRLEFNWSHSDSLALIALAWNLPLGVDVEALGKKPRALEIARRFFDPGEARELAALDPGTGSRAFISLWCAKEAVLKAAGKGLSFGLARLAFHYDPALDWQLADLDPVLGAVADWQLESFPAANAYRGALAWRGSPRRIHAFRTPASACLG